MSIRSCGAGGIGYCLVQQFQAAGCTVFASARRLDSIQSLQPLPGVHLVQLDVCSSDSIKAAVAEVSRTAGRIDVLVRIELASTISAAVLQLPVHVLLASFALLEATLCSRSRERSSNKHPA